MARCSAWPASAGLARMATGPHVFTGGGAGALHKMRPSRRQQGVQLAGAVQRGQVVRAADGRAIVADDMHLALRAPNIWFRARLRYADTTAPGGKVDVAIAGINPTDERKKSMDFSADYLPTEQKVIIRKADADKYKTVEDLYGKTIGVQKSTTQEALAKEKIKDAKIVGLAHVPEVVLELKQGKVDGLVVEGIVGEQYVIFNDDLMFSDIKFPGAVKNSAAAVQKGNEDVLAVINEVIKENTDNGNFKKWTEEYSKKAVSNADNK